MTLAAMTKASTQSSILVYRNRSALFDNSQAISQATYLLFELCSIDLRISFFLSERHALIADSGKPWKRQQVHEGRSTHSVRSRPG